MTSGRSSPAPGTVPSQRPRQRERRADLEDVDVLPAPFLQHVAQRREGDPRGDDAQPRRLRGGKLVVVAAPIRLELPADFLQSCVVLGMGDAHESGQRAPARGVAVELDGQSAGPGGGQRNRLARVGDARRRAQDGHDAVPFGQRVGVGDHGRGLRGVSGVEAGDLGEHREKTAVLLVLRAVGTGVVGGDEKHAALEFVKGRRHEGVGGDVQPHVLHDAAGTGPGEGGGDGHLVGNLLVCAPLHGKLRVLCVREAGHGRKDLRGRRPRIGGCDLTTRSDDRPRDRLVAQKQFLLLHRSTPLKNVDVDSGI